MGISAVLIVKNEEKNIVPCLEALRFTDEIVVVDSGSTDKTLELARPLATRVTSKEFIDFADQKNYAIGLAKQEWVLSIDADERVSEALRDEILQAITGSGAFAAYAIPRKTKLFGRGFVASGLQNDVPVRLFRWGKAYFHNPVHEVLKVEGKIGRLQNALEHQSFQTLHDYWEKLQRYTDLEIQNEKNAQPIRFYLDFFIRPFYRFLSFYVLKQGFRDGVEGFIYSFLSGYYEWVRRMKQWERLKT